MIIHEDITKAQTLPARFYRDPATFANQREKIFARSWQFAGDADNVRTPGSTWPFTMLEGFVDEPLLFTRDDGDALHCMSNVCTHRGNIVVAQGGPCRALRCAYHGRRFGLDGTFQFMPEFETACDFPSAADNLPAVPFAKWGPLLFAAIKAPCPFDEWIAPVQQRLGWLPLNDFRFEPTLSRDYLVHANWSLYCENYLEGFHIPYVHASLNAALDYGNYSVELTPHGVLQLGIGKGGDDLFDVPASSPDHGKMVAAYYYWLWPNIMLNFYPWGLSINVVRPIAVDVTKVSFLSYVWQRDKLGRGVGADLDRVEREDESVVEAVQRGVRSRLYDRGRYSPTREQGVHHFHRMLAAVEG